jgi:RPN1 N-terminal domain
MDREAFLVSPPKLTRIFVFAERESLKFKLAGAKDYDELESKGIKLLVDDNLGSWGHEFVRSLAGEIGQEYGVRVLDGADPESDEPFQDILKMVHSIVPFHIQHNAEAEAVDLLIEVQRLKFLLTLDSIDANNYERICLYLAKAADYMSDPDDLVVSSTAVDPYEKMNAHVCMLVTQSGNARDGLRDIQEAGAVLRCFTNLSSNESDGEYFRVAEKLPQFIDAQTNLPVTWSPPCQL